MSDHDLGSLFVVPDDATWLLRRAPALSPRIDPLVATQLQLLSLSSMVEGSSLQHCFPTTVEDLDPVESLPRVAPFPTRRRMERRSNVGKDEASDEIVFTWFEKSQIQLGTLVPEDMKPEVMRTFYTWRDLGIEDVKDLPATDLITHRVRLRPGTKPWNRSKRVHWSPGKRYWLDRIVQEGAEAGLYESTVAANGDLSDWSAEPKVVPKGDNPDEWAEPRFTVNYHNVDEYNPGVNISYLRDVHEHLSNPAIGSLSSFDLKHGILGNTSTS